MCFLRNTGGNPGGLLTQKQKPIYLCCIPQPGSIAGALSAKNFLGFADNTTLDITGCWRLYCRHFNSKQNKSKVGGQGTRICARGSSVRYYGPLVVLGFYFFAEALIRKESRSFEALKKLIEAVLIRLGEKTEKQLNPKISSTSTTCCLSWQNQVHTCAGAGGVSLYNFSFKLTILLK